MIFRLLALNQIRMRRSYRHKNLIDRGIGHLTIGFPNSYRPDGCHCIVRGKRSSIFRATCRWQSAIGRIVKSSWFRISDFYCITYILYCRTRNNVLQTPFRTIITCRIKTNQASYLNSCITNLGRFITTNLAIYITSWWIQRFAPTFFGHNILNSKYIGIC